MKNINPRKGYPFIRSGNMQKPADTKSINDSFQPFHAAIETSRNRLLIGAAVVFITFAAVGVKIVELSTPSGVNKIANKHGYQSEKGKSRSNIIDRNGNVLATDLTMAS